MKRSKCWSHASLNHQQYDGQVDVDVSGGSRVVERAGRVYVVALSLVSARKRERDADASVEKPSA